jgi:hypothetical protein
VVALALIRAEAPAGAPATDEGAPAVGSDSSAAT